MKTPYRFALAVATTFFLIGVATLHQYGLTWDAPENLLTGHHYLQFFLTGEAQWLDFPHYNQLYLTATDRPLFYNREFNAPERYPPVANMVAQITHWFFTVRLEWLSAIDGYHLSVLLFATLTMFVMVCFTWQAFGAVASLATALALATYPLFFEHAHHNLKDIPFAALTTLSLWAYWKQQQTYHPGWNFLSAVAAGLAMGTRILALQVWPILFLAYLPFAWSQRKKGWQAVLRPYLPFLLHIPLALTLFLVSWPWLWPDPIARLQTHLAFGQDVSRGLRVLYAGQLYESGVTLPWHYTAVIFTLTTPLVMFVGGVWGCLVVCLPAMRKNNPAAVLLLLLFLLSLLRTSWPTIPQYDGTRHMLEGIVAFAGLFGLGFQQAWEGVQRRWLSETRIKIGAPFLASALLLLIFLPLFFWNIRLHPYQGIFYNVLAGGPAGANGRYPQEYWGSSFRLGAAWLNQHIPPDTLILPRVGGHLARYYLHPTLPTIPDEVIPTLPPEQPIWIIYMVRVDKFDWVAEFAHYHLAPIFELKRAGVPVLKIVSTTAGTLQQVPP